MSALFLIIGWIAIGLSIQIKVDMDDDGEPGTIGRIAEVAGWPLLLYLYVYNDE